MKTHVIAEDVWFDLENGVSVLRIVVKDCKSIETFDVPMNLGESNGIFRFEFLGFIKRKAIFQARALRQEGEKDLPPSVLSFRLSGPFQGDLHAPNATTEESSCQSDAVRVRRAVEKMALEVRKLERDVQDDLRRLCSMSLHVSPRMPDAPTCQPDAVRQAIRRFADRIRHPPLMVNETRMVGLAGAVAHTRRDKEDDDCWQVCWRYRRWRDFVAHVLVAGWPRLYRENAR